MTADEWLRLALIPLGVAVLGGLIVAGALAIAIKPVREKFWKPIGRPIRWIFGIRLTTPTGRASADAEASQLGDEVARLKAVVDSERLQARALVTLAQGQAKSEVTRGEHEVGLLKAALSAAEAKTQEEVAAARAKAEASLTSAKEEAEVKAALAKHEFDQRTEKTKELSHGRGLAFGHSQGLALGHSQGLVDGIAEGRAQALAEVEAQRAAPLPKPVWSIEELNSDQTFRLLNTQPGVALSDVSIDAGTDYFTFGGPTQWPGPVADDIQFAGRRMRRGKSFGVTFTISWRDIHGDLQRSDTMIDKVPIRAFVG